MNRQQFKSIIESLEADNKDQDNLYNSLHEILSESLIEKVVYQYSRTVSAVIGYLQATFEDESHPSIIEQYIFKGKENYTDELYDRLVEKCSKIEQ